MPRRRLPMRPRLPQESKLSAAASREAARRNQMPLPHHVRRVFFALLPAAIACLCLCVSAGSAFSRAPSPLPSADTKVAAIEQYCSELERTTGAKPDLIVGQVETAEHPSGEWRKFATREDLHKGWEESAERYLGAYVWLRNGEVARVNFTLEAPSGDWIQYTGHCFREGALAKLSYELRSVVSQTIVRRQRFFDDKGHPLRSYEEFFDLETERPKRPSGAFADEPTTVYYHVADLPFISLVKKP